jgi:hypothetical protein
MGIPYWAGALGLAVLLVLALVALEAWRPWRDDLGSDVDGDLATPRPASSRIRAVPAE